MPLYEYSCRKCGAKFEHLQSSTSSKKPPCPQCQSATVEKQMSAFAISVPQPAPCGTGRCGGCEGSPRCPMSLEK